MGDFSKALIKAGDALKKGLKMQKSASLDLTKHLIENITSKTNIIETDAALIIEKAVLGGEINKLCEPEKWLNERFLPNTVAIEIDDYARMCIDALKIVGSTAGTDYGSSRQRDLGQQWADMTRGYLGEIAVSNLLKEKYGIECKLGHERGTVEDYLPSDIHSVKFPEKDERRPKIDVGIKATKWNGIWFDIPGDQFNHSDFHILVKVGTGRDHLFSFFKEISVFKEKILPKGIQVGSISGQDEAKELFDEIPTFNPVSAYICGFAGTAEKYENLSYSGNMGRKNYTITKWCGPMYPGDLAKIKENENVEGTVEYQSIKKFSHDNGYLFNTGCLNWDKKSWDNLVQKL